MEGGHEPLKVYHPEKPPILELQTWLSTKRICNKNQKSLLTTYQPNPTNQRCKEMFFISKMQRDH